MFDLLKMEYNYQITNMEDLKWYVQNGNISTDDYKSITGQDYQITNQQQSNPSQNTQSTAQNDSDKSNGQQSTQSSSNGQSTQQSSGQGQPFTNSQAK